jgi:hypothetical protein
MLRQEPGCEGLITGFELIGKKADQKKKRKIGLQCLIARSLKNNRDLSIARAYLHI